VFLQVQLSVQTLLYYVCYQNALQLPVIMITPNELEKASEVVGVENDPQSPGYSTKKTHGGIVLVPQPTDDPKDPLNWPKRRKYVTLAVLCLAAFAGLASSTAHLSSLVVQAKVYHRTPTDLSYSVSSALAGLMIGPVLFVPLAQVVGVSSCIFWSAIGAMACAIWSAEMTGSGDYISFVWSRAIGGMFGSVAQCVGNAAVVNMFFLHERGKAFAIFAACFTLGTVAGPTFGGFIISHDSWDVEFWWVVALLGLVAILSFFFLEETGFSRDGRVLYPQPANSFLRNRFDTFFPGTKVVPRISGPELAKFAVAPFLIGISPATILAGIFQMALFGFFVMINSLLSIFLQEPVMIGGYGFTPQRNAAFCFCLWVGILAAQVFSHWLNDRLPMWICRRRGGYWKPEYRLQTLWIPGLFLMPVGLGIFGSALQYHLHYMVLALGSFLVAFSAQMAVPVPINYLVESFKRNPQEVGTVMNVYRLVLGLVIPFFVDAWEARVGIGWVFGMAAFFCAGSFLCIILLMWKGHEIRDFSFARVASAEEGARVVDRSASSLEL